MKAHYSFMLLISLLTSCGESTTKSIEKSAKSENIAIEFANCFSIENSKDHYILTIQNPDNKDHFEFAIGKDSTSKNCNLTIPTNRMVLLSASMIGRASLLKTYNEVIGVSDTAFLFNPTLRSRASSGKIMSFGDVGNFPIEKLIKSDPDVVMFSDFGNEFPKQKELKKMGVILIPDLDWRENHPLGKAEWILVHGLLTGRLKEAQKIFSQIKAEYLQLTVSRKPSETLCLSGFLYGDTWWSPSGESYTAKLFRDAGIKYIYSRTKGTGSIPRSIEEILYDCKSADIWFNPGFDSKKKLLQISSKIKHLESFKKNKVFCYSHNMNYFWEMSAMEPQKVLSDLISISKGDTVNLYFYKKLN
jgi:iron complex transport system substrate-binding protein